MRTNCHCRQFRASRLATSRPIASYDISGEFSKRITEDFGVSIGRTYTRLWVPGGPGAHGWQNLETTFKYQFLTWPQSEFVLSAGVSVEWGRTGNASVRAEKFHTVTPTVWAGKGFGDLPSSFSFVRAFGVTAQVGYTIPTRRRTITVSSIDLDTGEIDLDEERDPHFLQYGGSQTLKPGILSLHHPAIAGEMTFGMRTGPIASSIEHGRWRISHRTD